MKKPELNCYYYRGDEDELDILGKVYFTVNWGFMEDYWRQLYTFGRPHYSDTQEMKSQQDKNENRHRGVFLDINIIGLRLNLTIFYKKVGYINWGRDMRKSAHWPGNEPAWVLRNREKAKEKK